MSGTASFDGARGNGAVQTEAWLNQDDNEEKQNYKAATDRFPLVTILQTADTLAARIIE